MPCERAIERRAIERLMRAWGARFEEGRAMGERWARQRARPGLRVRLAGLVEIAGDQAALQEYFHAERRPGSPLWPYYRLYVDLQGRQGRRTAELRAAAVRFWRRALQCEPTRMFDGWTLEGFLVGAVGAVAAMAAASCAA